MKFLVIFFTSILLLCHFLIYGQDNLCITPTPALSDNTILSFDNPKGGDYWNKYFVYKTFGTNRLTGTTNIPETPQYYQTELKKGLSLVEKFVYENAQQISPSGVPTVNVPPIPYSLCQGILLNPKAENLNSDVRIYNPTPSNLLQYTSFNFPGVARFASIYTLRRKFVPGFYRISLSMHNRYTSVQLLYGVAPNPITLGGARVEAINASSYNMKDLYLPRAEGTPNFRMSQEVIVYLEDDYNFLLKIDGFLVEKNHACKGLFEQNSILLNIVPLPSSQQVCTQYIAKPSLNTNSCKLTNISFDVHDDQYKYLFFYRLNSSTSYTIVPNLLKPINGKVRVENIPFNDASKSIPEWGVIRSEDGCTFIASTPISQIPTNTVSIDVGGIVPTQPERCKNSFGELKIPIQENINTTNTYDVVLISDVSTPQELKLSITAKEISSSSIIRKELYITDIPVDYTIKKVFVKGSNHSCANDVVTLPNAISFTKPMPNLQCTINQTTNACKTSLVATYSPNNYSCSKIDWYKTSSSGLPEYITTGTELNNPPDGVYSAKYIVGDDFVWSNQITINNPNNITLSSINMPDTYIIGSGDQLNASITIDDGVTSICPNQVVWTVSDIPSASLTNICTSIAPNPTVNIVPTIIFPTQGNYIVQAEVHHNNCIYTITKTIRVKGQSNIGTLIAQEVPALGLPRAPVYGWTENTLDESYFINYNENRLYFAYKGNYQASTSTTALRPSLRGVIYNAERTALLTFSVGTPLAVYNKQYGSTWYRLDLPTTVTIQRGQYILELYDENEWIRKMRFHVIPQVSPQCEIVQGCLHGDRYVEINNIITNDRPPYTIQWTVSFGTGSNLSEDVFTKKIDKNNDRLFYSELRTKSKVFRDNFDAGRMVTISAVVTDLCNNTPICQQETTTIATPCPTAPIMEVPRYQLFFNVTPQNTPPTKTTNAN